MFSADRPPSERGKDRNEKRKREEKEVEVMGFRKDHRDGIKRYTLVPPAAVFPGAVVLTIGVEVVCGFVVRPEQSNTDRDPIDPRPCSNERLSFN
ncbi:hypothetical protein EYF80_043024 [Liparis tanakae]|uniref:Uncharacterized protein n=1 Tax=Liparis tanakae TaxID=230148 RepID=A0A4Z2G2M4_9TELE|nr:hypothetical protein EYF80_043024 [Liparis tanakae]